MSACYYEVVPPYKGGKSQHIWQH